eukprot:CFRG6558T1
MTDSYYSRAVTYCAMAKESVGTFIQTSVIDNTATIDEFVRAIITQIILILKTATGHVGYDIQQVLRRIDRVGLLDSFLSYEEEKSHVLKNSDSVNVVEAVNVQCTVTGDSAVDLTDNAKSIGRQYDEPKVVSGVSSMTPFSTSPVLEVCTGNQVLSSNVDRESGVGVVTEADISNFDEANLNIAPVEATVTPAIESKFTAAAPTVTIPETPPSTPSAPPVTITREKASYPSNTPTENVHNSSPLINSRSSTKKLSPTRKLANKLKRAFSNSGAAFADYNQKRIEPSRAGVHVIRSDCDSHVEGSQGKMQSPTKKLFVKIKSAVSKR